MINELNGLVHRILTSCEQKERDKASKLILTMLEITAKKTSENTEVCKRLTNQVGKLASFVYRTQYERCQSWKDAATALKRFAEERVGELKVQQEGDDSSLAKIEACNARISEMKVWRMYQPSISI